ncbi:MAG: helix-hairpin-helix domain-containing protein, partial [Candidatus Nanoarchaeia archaeon]
LEGFPGIGPKISSNLLEKFSSLKEILNASPEQLAEIKGFNKNKIQEFRKLID